MPATALLRAAAAAGALLLLGPAPAAAQFFKLGEVEIGGAARFNFWQKSWERTNNRPIDELEVDTFRLRANFDDGTTFASAQYRYYIYPDGREDSHFPHHAYIGRRFGEDREAIAGIQQVPFGLLPFAGNSFFFSIAYYVGLEDDQDLGFTYRQENGSWTQTFGYFPRDEGSYFGISEDSARYSYDVVQTPDRRNQEAHQFNYRLARDIDVGPWSVTAGLSLQAGAIPNDETERTGRHHAAAIHARAARGPFEAKWQSTTYEYDLEGPPGEDARIVPMGAYDFAYDVAADASIHAVSLSYRLEPDLPKLDSVTVYNDYSILSKRAAGFSDTQHNILGAAFDIEGPLFLYLDGAMGQHNAWIGRSFGSALGRGSVTDEWEYRINLNVGAYF